MHMSKYQSFLKAQRTSRKPASLWLLIPLSTAMVRLDFTHQVPENYIVRPSFYKFGTKIEQSCLQNVTQSQVDPGESSRNPNFASFHHWNGPENVEEGI